MINYDGWDREYLKNKAAYLDIFDTFMSQLNYENNEEFEDKIKRFVGREHVVSVASATDALAFSLLSHGIGPGDEVLVTDFSWISTSSCISMVGATPVFCDIDLDSYHISLDSIKRMRTEKTKAIIYTHLFGNMVDVTEIMEYCKEHKIFFIEDAAQSIGSSYNKVKAGSIGHCSSYSFNTNKVIAGINGGGVFMTDNKDKANIVKKLRRHGKDKDFEMLGHNSRMYVLNSMIVLQRMKNMFETQKTRQEIAQRYNEAFADLPIITQSRNDILDHNFHKYTIRFNDKETRKKVKDNLALSIHYERPLSENSMYKDIKHRKDRCDNAKLVADTIVSLPVHAYLHEEEITKIIYTVKEQMK
tara:strand:+ start:732 stop:1808 length:1077 start_codon:yes stop_codon:yes gene_type:complete